MLKPLLITVLALAVVAAVVFVGGKYLGEETAGWKTYDNEEYGFSLNFPQTWENYVVETGKQNWGIYIGETNSLIFGFPEQKDLFVIYPFQRTIITMAGINKTNPIDSLGPVDYLGENSNFVFYYQTAQETINNELGKRLGEVESILKSFKLASGEWKTYRNKEYGFEIKYPPMWATGESSFTTVSFTPRTGLNVFENPQRLPLAEWIEKERGDLVSQMHPVTINGVTALRGKESGLVGDDAVYFGKGTLVVAILSQENSQDTAIFETMLPTFKFTK